MHGIIYCLILGNTRMYETHNNYFMTTILLPPIHYCCREINLFVHWYCNYNCKLKKVKSSNFDGIYYVCVKWRWWCYCHVICYPVHNSFWQSIGHRPMINIIYSNLTIEDGLWGSTECEVRKRIGEPRKFRYPICHWGWTGVIGKSKGMDPRSHS